MPGSPVRLSDAPDASQSEICKQLARVVLDFAKPVYLTPPASGIRILVYKDARNNHVDVPEYDLVVTESQVWVRTAERYKTPTDVVIMELERFEDFLGLHAPTRYALHRRHAAVEESSLYSTLLYSTASLRPAPKAQRGGWGSLRGETN